MDSLVPVGFQCFKDGQEDIQNLNVKCTYKY